MSKNINVADAFSLATESILALREDVERLRTRIGKIIDVLCDKADRIRALEQAVEALSSTTAHTHTPAKEGK